MKTKKSVILTCLLILSVGLSCQMVDTLTGSESAGTVDRLWTDVPAFEGATKTDMAIPLAARLIIQAAMQGKINFIAFTTNSAPQEVQNFYTKERMAAAGWTASEEGCVGSAQDQSSQAAACFFNRKDGAKEEGLAIIVTRDEQTKQTQIFYARIDLPAENPTPTP